MRRASHVADNYRSHLLKSNIETMDLDYPNTKKASCRIKRKGNLEQPLSLPLVQTYF